MFDSDRTRSITTLGVVLSCGLATSLAAQQPGRAPVDLPSKKAPRAALPRRAVALAIDSGPISGPEKGDGPRVVYSTTVMSPRAPWVRVEFGEVRLWGSGETDHDSYVLVTSLADGAVQRLDARGLKEWASASAYFNGDAVRIEVVAHPGAGPSRLVINRLIAGDGAGGADSLCGPADDRVLSTDSRVARVLPAAGGVCTAFIIGDTARCMLSAGQCAPGAGTVVQFNVPLSNGSGTIVAPAPWDQYAIDPTSIQSASAGPGSDWAYFGVFANPNTGMGAFSAQGGAFAVASAPAPTGQSVSLTGHGSVAAPVSLTRNHAQKIGGGPYTGLAGSTLRHQIDATLGDAGAPVTLAGQAIGIHTGDGCIDPPGSSFNTGTAMQNAALQAALAAPAGMCSRTAGPARPPLYLAGDASNALVTVNRTSGAFGIVGATGVPGEIRGLAYDRGRGRFYATEAVPGGPDRLHILDRATGAATLVGVITGPADVHGLAFDPNTDTLYGIDQGSGQLYRISHSTAAATPVGAAGNPGVGGIDFDPVSGTIYGVDDSQAAGTRLVTIDPSTGARSVVGPLGSGITDCDGLAYCADDRFLYTVDQATGTALRVDPATGAATVIGAAGAMGTMGAGMACDYECAPPCQPVASQPPDGGQQLPITTDLSWLGCPNQKVFSLDVNPGQGINLLYDVLTATGASTRVGPLTPGSNQLTGLTWNGRFMYAIDLATGNLVRLNTLTGAPTMVGPTGITGWQGLASQISDNGQLYGITQSNSLYRINQNSGAATLVAAGVGNLVTALEFDPAGQLWGIEFSTGRILKINKSTGAITVSATTIAGFQGLDFDDAGTAFGHNSSGADKLYTLNLATGMATLRGPSNTSTVTAMAFGMATDSPPPGLMLPPAPEARGAVYDPTNFTLSAPAPFDASKVIDADHRGTPPGMTAVEGRLYPRAAAPTLPPPTGGPPGDAICGGTLVNFDSAYAPCSFALTTRATGQFSALGVVFEGPGGNDGGAILDQCSGFGVTGISAPNALAFNPAAVLADGGIPRGDQTIRFTSPVSSVQVMVGSASPGLVTMQAFRGNTLVDSRNLALTSTLSALSVSGSGITRVVLSFPGPLVLDDLCFVQSCPTTYDLYFGTDNPPTTRVLQNSINTFFDPGSLDSTTLYSWRVVAKNCCGQTAGPVWQFSTLCYPNCDQSTVPPVLNVNDFVCFMNKYAIGDPYANCDDSLVPPVLNVNDFTCFLNKFAAGCP